jgi:hypothetical protein
MMKYLAATLTAGGMTAVTLGLAHLAGAAPTGPSQVEQTVKTLQASGYHVIVNRSGAAPLASCTVSSVRQGQEHSTVDSRGGSSPVTTVISKTVYLDVTC